MKRNDWLLYAGLAVAGFIGYEWLKKSAANAVNAVTQPIANAYVSLTSPAPPQVQGMILMPDGTTIPAASVSTTWIGNALTFSYYGSTYQLYGHDANGNYPAAPYLG